MNRKEWHRKEGHRKEWHSALIPCIAFAAIAFITSAFADEGMIPINQLSAPDLAKRGFQLKAGEIFDPENVCLVDGICRVNGCTGSFVSELGLIITNHHCAYGAIQSSSSKEHDYLADGFKAADRQSELPARGYTVRITESYTDVSEQVLKAVQSGQSAAERTKAIERRRKEIEKDAESRHPNLRAEVAEMFAGRTYGLFLYTYLRDVRLVFAPPASIGNFGGEIDNWEWPRHTGDFSFMRAYTAPDGTSADYSPNNVPYKPKRFLQVSGRGVEEGDFVFLLGYPGKTSRHKTASFLKYEQEKRLPFIAREYQWQIETMEKAGQEDRAIALKHASHMRSLANVEKRSRGQLIGMKRAGSVAARQKEEQQLQAFIDANPDRSSRYGKVLSDIENIYRVMTDRADAELALEQMTSASRTLNIAFTLFDAASERLKPDLDRETPYMDRNYQQTIKSLMLVVDDLHLPTDRLMLQHALENLVAAGGESLALLPVDPSSDLSSSLKSGRLAESTLAKTRLSEPAFVEECLKLSPEQLQMAGDSAISFVAKLYPAFLQLRQQGKLRSGDLDRLYGELVEVKQQFLSRDFIPDANGTLRMTSGHIRGYSPEDGILKTPITTLKGLMDKATGKEPFEVPEVLRQVYEAKDFGAYIHPKLQQVPVAILYDTDTTGGNSGSPVLNARGELVGVNFDRAFEATINDFAWNTDYSRSIGVDIRYCLWITDKVYGARYLLDEMHVQMAR